MQMGVSTANKMFRSSNLLEKLVNMNSIILIDNYTGIQDTSFVLEKWMLLNDKWAIVQPYHGENKLHW